MKFISLCLDYQIIPGHHIIICSSGINEFKCAWWSIFLPRVVLPPLPHCQDCCAESCNPIMTGQRYCLGTTRQTGSEASLRKIGAAASSPTTLHTTHRRRLHKHTYTPQPCLPLFTWLLQPKYPNLCGCNSEMQNATRSFLKAEINRSPQHHQGHQSSNSSFIFMVFQTLKRDHRKKKHKQKTPKHPQCSGHVWALYIFLYI